MSKLPQLEVHDGKLSLVVANSKPVHVLNIDFLQGQYFHRQRFGGGRKQLIARAVGIKANLFPCVIDATAGLGQDAFVLASLGCDVTMVERSPVVAALLADALQRAQVNGDFRHLKLQFILQDSLDFLCQLSPQKFPDVIYLDPMYPHSSKSALNKITMRLLREVVGDDQDAAQLLQQALRVAKNRVVVKRPRLAPALIERKPDIVYAGKSSRFDVYLV